MSTLWMIGALVTLGYAGAKYEKEHGTDDIGFWAAVWFVLVRLAIWPVIVGEELFAFLQRLGNWKVIIQDKRK